VNSRILKTKLFIPPLKPNLVSRPRLSEQLEAAFRARTRCTLVAAPAGFGKTTAIISWLDQGNPQAAWVSLDENDNEPAVFWAYVIAALQLVQPNFMKNVFADPRFRFEISGG
jgi:LuxR family maltose regulon positive regulatory protein